MKYGDIFFLGAAEATSFYVVVLSRGADGAAAAAAFCSAAAVAEAAVFCAVDLGFALCFALCFVRATHRWGHVEYIKEIVKIVGPSRGPDH